MAEKRPEVTVELLEERVLPIFRGELPPAHTIAVTYTVPRGLPRTLWLSAEEFEREKTKEFLEQLKVREGPLYEKWVKYRAAKIREDLERERVFVPEKIGV